MPGGIARICNDARRAKTRFDVPHSVEHCTSCEARGVEHRASLLPLGEGAVAPGDFVVVDLGHALHKIDADEARRAWAVVDEMLAALDAGRSDSHR